MLRHSQANSETGRADRPAAVRIQVAGAILDGDLIVPESARGIVLFAHGSGSSRHSSRNRAVAAALQFCGLGTLLMDLLTAQEDAVDQRTGHLRFDIPLLARRLIGAIDWINRQAATHDLNIGLFGASTGAAAALVAAAVRAELVRAVASRGGRPDLAGSSLALVRCPTLLIVGERDEHVIQLNREAMARMRAPTRLVIVPGATHLFQEPGALDEVARFSGDWFVEHLARPWRNWIDSAAPSSMH